MSGPNSLIIAGASHAKIPPESVMSTSRTVRAQRDALALAVSSGGCSSPCSRICRPLNNPQRQPNGDTLERRCHEQGRHRLDYGDHNEPNAPYQQPRATNVDEPRTGDQEVEQGGDGAALSWSPHLYGRWHGCRWRHMRRRRNREVSGWTLCGIRRSPASRAGRCMSGYRPPALRTCC